MKSELDIDRHVEEINSWLINKRRDFHQHPELANKETRTSKKIIESLEKLGLEVKKDLGKNSTGVTGLIKGKNKNKTIGLRVDMDALEIKEETDLSFASNNSGIMHACGHDAHTTIGLGVANVLMKIKDQLNGNVKIIFQPAEEDGPHGGGARPMIKDGVLEDPKVDALLGLHIWPELMLGQVGTKKGPITASSDPFTIKVTGKETHGAYPHLGIDSVLVGSNIVNNIHTIISRNID